MKKIGFLSFGHWTPSPQSQARSAADVLLQSIDLSQSRMFPLLSIIDNYLKRSGVSITAAHEADHVTMGMSLIALTRGVGLLPAYAQNFLFSSVTSRPLKGGAPTVDLVLGYRKSNQSPILKIFLSRLDELVSRVSNKAQ